MKRLTLQLLLLAVAGAFCQCLPAAAQTSGLLREVWTGIPGTAVSDLTNNPAYPDNPTSTDYVTDFFEAPIDIDNDYGQRMHGFILPPQTGSYTFWISSDDNSTLFLSTDETPANVQTIAYVPGWTTSREWTRYAEQQSAPISLVAGSRYYIEALQKEGGGGDNLAVMWELPDSTMEEPIPASRLLPWGTSFTPPIITQQPTNTTVVEGQPATFSIRVSNLDPVSYQWRRGGANIPGANNAIYTIPAAVMGDNGAQFSCYLTNSLGNTNSATARLSITPDTNPPTLFFAVNVGSTNVKVSFSEPVEAASATTFTNYSLNNGVSVSSAAFGSDTRTIVLTTSPLAFGTVYTLTVNKVRDRAAIPNTIAPGSRISFAASEFTPQDIGNLALAGSQTRLTNGYFNVTGGGGDIGGVSDQLQFSYQLRTGNFDVKARLQSVDLADVWTKAGLMAREDLTAGARFAGAMATPSLSGCFFEWRDPSGSAAATSGSFPVNYPATWLRLQRVGNQFTGYASYDGQTWTQVGSASIAMPATIYFGLAVSSHNSNQSATAQFRDITDVTGAVVGTLPVNSEPLGPSSRKTGLVISEIMYKPAPRGDGRNLEFIELFNANPFYEDIGGYRISGDIDFTFPTNTIVAGGSFLVVAKVPADIQSVYGIANVLGPYTGSLKTSGTVRLRSEIDAIYLEVPYDNKPPWPVAADGTGHSLVLARPSFGENDPRAWDISDVAGGSPGGVDGYHASPLRSVMVNEFLAHTDPPLYDYIELYNHSNQSVDVSGCTLSDDPVTNLFVIPPNTVIPARGFVYFDENQLGFRLSAVGETIYFKNPDGSRVLDCVQFEGQENAVSMGRWPDGASEFYPMQTRTPGAANSAIRVRDVVINEIMYSSISGDDIDQYVELYNKGANAINVGGWRFTAGIDYLIPTNTVIPASGYLVVAKNAANLFARYANLNTNNTVGDFGGHLSGSGERLAVSMPDLVINTNTPGITKTNIAWIVVDEVTYGVGGRWGQWSHGGGSSLELIDPRSNHRLAYNWADSDESSKAPWTNIEVTATMDNGSDYNDSGVDLVQVGLLGAGECLIDNVEFRPGGPTAANLIANPDFESGLGSWTPQGDHVRSFLETANGFLSAHSLHIRASDQMWTAANCVRGDLTTIVPDASGQTATLRFKAKWLKGWPEVLMRVHGNWIEDTGRMAIPSNLGTPGARNSRAAANTGPAIYQVSHSPAIPAANQSVVVTARVHDPDGIQSVQLNYRVDPSGTYTKVTMADNGAGGDAVAGDGIYSATIPGKPTGTNVAFYVQASDASSASARFPTDLGNGAPVRECVVCFGDATPASSFGAYHLWLTQNVIDLWSNLPNMSNEPHDGTWVCGNRVIYNMSSRYAGSPYHQQFNSPVGNYCHYHCDMPEDDKFLGATSFNKIHAPGNGPFDDDTIQREQTCYWMVRQLGLPWNYRRFVAMYVNGNRRGTLMEDSQVPNGDVIDEYFSGDTDGQLYKLQPWFEFDPDGYGFNNKSWCTLNDYTTTGGAKKLASYRWNYLTRKAQTTASDYTNVFALIDAANTYATSSYVANMDNLVDMEEWLRIFAIEHAVGNWDAFGSQNAQNMYGYKPTQGKWNLLIWDYNIVLGNSGSWGPNGNNLFSYNGADGPMGEIYANATFRRAYLRAFKEIANGPMLNANVNPVMDAKYAAFAADGVTVNSPSGVKGWIATMRNSLLSTLNNEGANAAFAITSNGGNNFSTNKNYITISGEAPVEVKTITINGIAYPATWNSVTGWSIKLALSGGANSLAIQGLDYYGNPVAGATDSITVNYTATAELPQGHVFINEIMYNPALPNASFIELYNSSTINAFDLSGFRLDGASFTFPGGSIIPPTGFLVVASDAPGFVAAYGSAIPLAGVFNGKLQNNGETLKLVRPGATPDQDVIINQVTYDGAPPWPTDANGFGPSLQLIDPTQDNNRVANWAVATTNNPSGPQYTPGAPNSVRTNLALPLLWLNEVQPDNVTGIQDRFGHHHPWAELYNSGTNALNLSAYFLANNYTNLAQWAFPAGASINPGQFLVVYVDGNSSESVSNELHTSFAIPTVTGSVVLTRFAGGQTTVIDYLNYKLVNADRSYGAFADGTPAKREKSYFATPGGTNSNTWPAVPVTINEWMAGNTGAIADPADGHYDDWFELYNAGPTPVDLSGYTLTDNLTNTTPFTVPAGYTVPANGFLLVWADNDTNQNSTNDPNLHVNFKLSQSGEGIWLFAPNGTNVEGVTFGQQTNDISQGRWPDGNSGQYYFMPTPTPGAANLLGTPTNHAPALAAIDNQTINEGSQLLFTAAATDPDSGQTLSYSLDPGAPSGASINASSGVFVWTPTEAQGPGTYPVTVRVTDNGLPPLSDAQTFTIVVNSAVEFRFTGIAMSGNGVVTLNWTSQVGKTYRVEYKDDLAQTNWNALGDFNATGSIISATNTVSGTPQRYYRIQQF